MLSRLHVKCHLCFVLAGIICSLPSILLSEESSSLVPFDLRNANVNLAIIDMYENNPSIWESGQLYLVGVCYLTENRMEKAQALFELISSKEESGRVLRALGNIHAIRAETEKAVSYYTKAWEKHDDYLALKQLAFLRLQHHGVASVEPLVPSLLVNRDKHVEIMKVLLAFCVLTENKELGAKVCAQIAREPIDADLLEKDEELRKMLFQAATRYASNGEGQMQQEIEDSQGQRK